MKQKLFTLFFALVASIGMMKADIIERVKIGELYYNLDTDNKTAEITNELGMDPYWKTEISAIDIPESFVYDNDTYNVTRIGKMAFYSSSLQSITIPESVSSIGESAFAYCRKLESVDIPNSVHSLGSHAFQSCEKLTSISLSNQLSSIEEETFYFCSSLPSIVVPSSITKIGDHAFWQCRSLQSIDLHDNISILGNYVFLGCSMMTSINVAQGNQYYSSLDGVLFDKDQTVLIQCPGGYPRSTYSIPCSVRSIGSSAFEFCQKLTHVSIPNSVTHIGNQVFYGCINIKSPLYNDHIFAYYPQFDTKKSYVIPSGIETIAGGAFMYCTNLTNIALPASVQKIGENAFLICDNLNVMRLPKSVKTIGARAFTRCKNLTAIYVDVENPNFSDQDGVLFSKDKTMLLQYPVGRRGEYTIPEDVMYIGDLAFYGCDFTYMQLPNNVKSIGKEAFNSCKKMTAINIPNGVERIEDYAFYCCEQLNSIVIPNSVTHLGDFVFDDCGALTNATIGDNVEKIGKYAFHLCRSLKNISIGEKVESIGDMAFSFCHKLRTINLPPNVTTIGDYAFAGSSLSTISLPEKVSHIGEGAFAGCGLGSIYNYAVNPIVIDAKTVRNFNRFNCALYVLEKSVDSYKEANIWKDFNPILPIVAENAAIDSIQITPLENAAELVWKKEENAVTYEFVLKDVEDNNIYSLLFGENGILISQRHYAPLQDKINEKSESPGFSYFISDLHAGTNYHYSMLVRDEQEVVIKEQSGSFMTSKATYIITFVDWDGKKLQILNDVEEGITPEYSGTIPARLEEEKCTYVFAGWIPNIVPATGNATYTATYAATKYTITFKNDDGSILYSEEWEYGTTPYCDSDIIDDIEDDCHIFSGWQPEIIAVNEDAVYTAILTATSNTEGLDGITNDKMPTKVLRNGQIYILRGDKTYTVQGQEVK